MYDFICRDASLRGHCAPKGDGNLVFHRMIQSVTSRQIENLMVCDCIRIAFHLDNAVKCDKKDSIIHNLD
jgi:hypothetical protein